MNRQRLLPIWLSLLALPAMSGVSRAATLTLAWDPSVDSPRGYVISFGTLPGSYTARIDVGNKTLYSVDGLRGAMIYYFVVQAYDANGVLGNPSSEVSGQAPPDPLSIT